MLTYTPPLRDYRFVLEDVLQLPKIIPQLPEQAHIDLELIHAVLESGARFSAEVLLPLNAPADHTGCELTPNGVRAPSGFAEAYRQYQAAGWPALTVPVSVGGQGFPGAAGVLFGEMVDAANMSFGIFSNVREGVLNCITQFGDETVQRLFSSRLASGEWLGTMCLTEPQAGSDLGLIHTTAALQMDGRYVLSGNKIFISNGDHDLTANIVHLVLARTTNAPLGTRGLSLFAVPKFRLNANGEPEGRNGVLVTGLEHKHGIRANATCALAFDQADAYLVGELHRGLSCMFVLMNRARLAVGVQAVGLADIALQNATRYAHDRLQGRGLSGVARTDLPADPLSAHINVKNDLVQHRLFVEAARLLAAWVGTLMDQARGHPDAATRERSGQLVELLTPVVKGYLTQKSCEHIQVALQIFGGHGYIVETGMEQLVRDAAIGPLYEGTNAIQALDLLGRKVIGDQGARLKVLGEAIVTLARQFDAIESLKHLAAPLLGMAATVKSVSESVMVETVFNRDVPGLVASEYLDLLGTAVFAYLWGWMARAAAQADSQDAFYRNKVALASLFVRQAQRRVASLAVAIGDNRLRARALADIDLG